MQTFKRLLTAVASLLLLLSSMPLVSAQATASGSGLSISPTLFEYTLTPGQSANLSITLKDATVGAIDAQAVVNDFVADGTTGNPKILTQPGASSPNSIKNFVYQLSNVPLNPGQQKIVTVGIHIPDGTAPGAYYGVIRYKAVPTGAAAPAPGQVALTASVGTIVLITVPGNLRTLVKLNSLHIYHGTQDGHFFLNKPDHIGVEIQNLGNGFIRPFGTVEVQNMFHREIDSFQFNNPKQLGNVLPNSTRIFTNAVSGISQPGRYTVSASVAYTSGGNVLTIKKTFWYIPTWLALTIAAILLILILLTIRLYVRYRRDARHSYRR
ncbi:MAG TPA: hypothetical protein VEH48_02970 [Candidatus Nitrosopolaris sp.]|nr:hypothetical protein [Candidatus Nitrosopolaris sp.]